MDLYGRLEELQGMTRLLIDDVGRLQGELGAGMPDPSDAQQTNRRFYIRAVFALVEAFVDQHRRWLVELAEHQMINLPEKKPQRLWEIKAVTLPDGSVEEQEQYLQLFDKIKEVYKAAGVGFGQSLKVTFGDTGWVTFKDAMDLRHRVTHPKKVEDCWIFEKNIQTVIAANAEHSRIQTSNAFTTVNVRYRAVRKPMLREIAPAGPSPPTQPGQRHYFLFLAKTPPAGHEFCRRT